MSVRIPTELSRDPSYWRDRSLNTVRLIRKMARHARGYRDSGGTVLWSAIGALYRDAMHSYDIAAAIEASRLRRIRYGLAWQMRELSQ